MRGQPVEQPDQGVDAVGEEVGLLVGRPVGLGGPGHPLHALGLVVVGPDHVAPGVVLLHHAGEHGHGLLPLPGVLEVLPGHHLGDDHAQGHEHQEDAGEGGAVIAHDDQGADNGAHRHDELQKPGLEHLGHLVQVAGHPAEQLPGLVLVKKAQGEPVQLPGHLAAQGEHQALRHAGHQVGLEVVHQPHGQVLQGQGEQLRPQPAAEGEGGPGPPAVLDARPQVVDDHRAVHGGPDGQGHITQDGKGHHAQARPLALQVAEEPGHGARFFSVHVSSASLVWDS